MLLRRARAYSR